MQSYLDFDLNLLRALDALLAERNVTRAAARVGVTQSAMSRSLGRLRALLGDPLLVRARRGMEPTARALALVEPVRRLLENISEVIGTGTAFDPATARRTFTIASADLGEYLLLPALLARLAERAPHVDIVVARVPRDLLGATEAREIDLVIGPPYAAPGSLRARKLMDEQFACIVRRDHPGVGKRMTLRRYVDLPHLLIAPSERSGGVVDRVLAGHGERRRVALRVPTFLVAPEVVAATDLVATVPRRMALRFARSLPLRVLTPPLDIPGFSLAQLWHPRDDSDPAHRWLRGEVAAVAREI